MCCKLAFEFILSNLLFKQDLSRVIYSREDIAFRRRVEEVGVGHQPGESISSRIQQNPLSLNLPFATYAQEGSYEPDDRTGSMNASAAVMGQMQPDSGIIVKALPVMIKYSSTAFFSRRDDVNIASQLLYWEQQPKFPVYYIVQHTLSGYPIDIPVFVTLETFNSNPDYAEKDWLTRSKIFPIKMEFTVRSYQTLIESIDSGILLPLRFSGLYGYNNEEVVFTQKSSLIWADAKWPRPPSDNRQWDSADNEIHLPQNMDPHWKPPFDMSSISNGDLVTQEIIVQDPITQQIDVTVADAISGYFAEDRNCVLDAFWQDDELTTENSVMIKWQIKEADKQYFENIVIYVPGIARDEIREVGLNEFELRTLHPGSDYDVTLIVTSKEFTKLTYKLTVKTKGEPVVGKTLLSSFVGRTFQVETD